MKYTMYVSSVLTLALLIFGCNQKKTDSQVITADILISNVSVIDVIAGRTLPNRYVTIVDDKISEIFKREIKVNEACLRIDGSEKFLIPGLWDMHAHISFDHRYQLGLLLANGVTGARELWGVMDTIDYIRKGAADGSFLAPEIYAAGTIIDGKPTMFPGMKAVETEAEAREEVREQAKQGVDFVKVYSSLTKEAYMTIADEAEKQGLPFAGHIPETINTFEAIAAGQRTSEHLRSIQLTSSSKADSLRSSPGLASFSPDKIAVMVKSFDQNIFDSVVSSLAKSKMWLVPTLAAKRNYVYLNDTIRFSTDPTRNPLIDLVPKGNADYWKYLVEAMPKMFGKDFYVANQVRNSKDLSLMPELIAGGVNILAGTDYGNPYSYPGYTLHEELQILAENGMTNAQALRSATYSPAVFLNRETELGSVEKGRFADLVILNSNPLNDIRHTKNISSVLLRGKHLNKQALDSLVEVSRRWAKKLVSPIIENAQAYGINVGCAHTAQAQAISTKR